MFRKHIFLTIVLTVTLCTMSVAFAEVNAVTPSTNDINRTNGWAHVDQVQQNVGSTDLSFITTRSFYSCFEYRTDGDTSQKIADDNYNVLITDGLYPYYCENNSSSTHTINANEYVEVRMVFGAEADERFDWTRFDVLMPTYSCVGFDPPLDTDAIQVRNNKRVLPFKAKLVDEAGNPVTDINPPMLECNNIGGGGSTPVPVDDFLPAGKGTDGNQFEPTGDGWQYNLKLWNFGASTYECYMIPGDGYEIDPSCTVDVEVQD